VEKTVKIRSLKSHMTVTGMEQGLDNS